MKRALSTHSGVTMLELMVAIFIFSIVSYSLFGGLHVGDKIIGKAKFSSVAATLALNEAERIRNAALQGVRAENLTYTETVSGVEYTVSRQIIDSSGINVENYAFTELEIRVAPQGALTQPYIFKMVQGYCHQ